MCRQYNRGERRTSLQNKPIHDLIGMISELGIVGIIVVICTTVFAISWILLPFLVSTVQRSTYSCSRELPALNRRVDLIMSKILFESKESKELSPHDTISPTTTDGKVT